MEAATGYLPLESKHGPQPMDHECVRRLDAGCGERVESEGAMQLQVCRGGIVLMKYRNVMSFKCHIHNVVCRIVLIVVGNVGNEGYFTSNT
jgi:hypothetical protein